MSLSNQIIEYYTSPEDEGLDHKDKLRLVAHRILDDIGYSPAELPASPWDEIPGHPWEEWSSEVAANNTRLGYREWAWHRKEMEQDAADASKLTEYYHVEIREEARTRFIRTIEVEGASDPKEAFLKAWNVFHDIDNLERRGSDVEVLEFNYEAIVEAPDGEVFTFTDADDNEDPFDPEEHQAQ